MFSSMASAEQRFATGCPLSVWHIIEWFNIIAVVLTFVSLRCKGNRAPVLCHVFKTQHGACVALDFTHISSSLSQPLSLMWWVGLESEAFFSSFKPFSFPFRPTGPRETLSVLVWGSTLSILIHFIHTFFDVDLQRGNYTNSTSTHKHFVAKWDGKLFKAYAKCNACII